MLVPVAVVSIIIQDEVHVDEKCFRCDLCINLIFIYDCYFVGIDAYL